MLHVLTAVAPAAERNWKGRIIEHVQQQALVHSKYSVVANYLYHYIFVNEFRLYMKLKLAYRKM